MSGRYIPIELKIKILKRANERCEYCQSWMRNAIHTFHIDHVIPLDTIIHLRLNRIGLKNMRRLTILAGEHPPID